MKGQVRSSDPGKILAHARLYLWKYWRQYSLTAWEDADGILRRAYDTVEKEDRIAFMHALDGCSGDRTTIQNGGAGACLVDL